ncbi:hypothetical protein PLICRDRAFT_35900 [Plicaturopsis crispa FD-325 SS-3]|nr:hypothetical protein PLICRDRAFT_35900 [Plicaturopsis crispa FD-325 SS-3]
MGRRSGIDTSPPVHREMVKLDRDLFKRSIPVIAARVPAEKTKSVIASGVMKNALVGIPRIRPVVPDPSDPNTRLVVLRVSDEADLLPAAREFLKPITTGFSPYTVELDYDHWGADDILQAILPENLCDESPTGFSVIGHIAHVNLTPNYLPYKHIIGQVILDKNKAITTVVNKLNTIDTKFRFFKMEVIAGEPNFIVEHHESGCRFVFDFSKVYWNSRLHTEHERLVQLFKPEDVVADVMAGVGPFALPAAKKGCAVYANDLNPASAEYLFKNVVSNKLTELVRVSCEDGREFIKTVARRALVHPFAGYTGPRLTKSALKAASARHRASSPGHAKSSSDPPSPPPSRRRVAHFVMNLPDSAITFLDAFRGILVSNDPDMYVVYAIEMPMIHCHCFTRELDPERAEADIRQRVEERLGHAIKDDVSLHLVRSVAPNKDMYCISFRLPREVAFARD